jgi:hypothetical protein
MRPKQEHPAMPPRQRRRAAQTLLRHQPAAAAIKWRGTGEGEPQEQREPDGVGHRYEWRSSALLSRARCGAHHPHANATSNASSG